MSHRSPETESRLEQIREQTFERQFPLERLEEDPRCVQNCMRVCYDFRAFLQQIQDNEWLTNPISSIRHCLVRTWQEGFLQLQEVSIGEKNKTQERMKKGRKERKRKRKKIDRY